MCHIFRNKAVRCPTVHQGHHGVAQQANSHIQFQELPICSAPCSNVAAKLPRELHQLPRFSVLRLCVQLMARFLHVLEWSHSGGDDHYSGIRRCSLLGFVSLHVIVVRDVSVRGCFTTHMISTPTTWTSFTRCHVALKFGARQHEMAGLVTIVAQALARSATGGSAAATPKVATTTAATATAKAAASAEARGSSMQVHGHPTWCLPHGATQVLRQQCSLFKVPRLLN